MHVRAHAVLVSACTSDALGCVHASARAHAHGPSPPAARVGRRMIRYMQRLVATLARRYQSYPLSRATPFAWVACVVFFGVLYDGVLYDGLILTERCYRGPSTFLRLLVCGGLGQACGMSQPCRPTRRQGTPPGCQGGPASWSGSALRRSRSAMPSADGLALPSLFSLPPALHFFPERSRAQR